LVSQSSLCLAAYPGERSETQAPKVGPARGLRVRDRSLYLSPAKRPCYLTRMPFLPTPDILLAFTAASVLLILTPGPDMTFFLGQTLTAGRRRGFVALFGAMTGLCVHSMLAAFGL